jgi:hypothetical protein
MKRKLPAKIILMLSSFLFCFCPLTYSQITVTRGDFVNAWEIIVSGHDTVHSTISPGNSGAAQTWNLSAMLNHYTDSISFTGASSTPYAASFPAANLAGYNSLDSNYYFINANSSLIDVVGNVAPNTFTGTPLLLSFSPPLTQITFPSTLSTSFTVTNATAQNTFYYNTTITGLTIDSIRITITQTRSSLIDGWGTVSTPTNNAACLRQMIIDYTSTVIEGYVVAPVPLGWQPSPFNTTDTSKTYNYIAAGSKWSLAQVTTNNADSVTGAQYLLTTLVGIPEPQRAGNKDVMFYPNPSAGEMNISALNNNAASLDVFDLFGRKTESVLLNGNTVRHSFTSLAGGIYIFRVIDKKGQVMSTGKFSIEK